MDLRAAWGGVVATRMKMETVKGMGREVWAPRLQDTAPTLTATAGGVDVALPALRASMVVQLAMKVVPTAVGLVAEAVAAEAWASWLLASPAQSQMRSRRRGPQALALALAVASVAVARCLQRLALPVPTHLVPPKA